MGINNYKIVKNLGQGSYGSVYLAKNLVSKSNDEYVAIKKFLMNDKSSYNSFKNEVKILKRIKSNYLVRIIDYYKDSQYMYLVMEYAPKGDLEGYIRSLFKNNKKIDYKFLDTVIYQLTEGLNVLHKNNIIHRDIKLPNILIFKDNLVKITDFGVSKLLENGKLSTNTAIGTPYYMSPELFKGTPYNYSVDFWALGCLIYKFLTNKYPFEASNISLLCNKIIKGKYDLSIIPFKYKNIVKKLLEIGKNRADEKDLFQFILSNSNSFIKKKNELKPVNKKTYQIENEKIKISSDNPYRRKLDPILIPPKKYKTKEIEEITRKLEPIIPTKKYKTKEIEEITRKLEPINQQYIQKLKKLEFIDKTYNKKLAPIAERPKFKRNNINNYINNPFPKIKREKLEPINNFKSQYKKDFVRFNIQNIKNIKQKRF